MKNTLSLILTTSLLIGGGAAMTGCQTNRSAAMTRGVRATESIHAAADSAQTARQRIDTSLAALQDLTEHPVDSKAQYRQARAEVAALRSISEQISDSADDMRTRGDAYLADWSRQISTIQSPDLRNAAFDRRDEVAAKLRDISQRYQQVQAEFIPLRNNLSEIDAALGADLSQRGLETVRPFVAKAASNAQPVKESLDRLVQEFRDVGLSLQPIAPVATQSQPANRTQQQKVYSQME